MTKNLPLVKSGVKYGAVVIEEQFHLLSLKTVWQVSAAKIAAFCTCGIASIVLRHNFACNLAKPYRLRAMPQGERTPERIPLPG